MKKSQKLLLILSTTASCFFLMHSTTNAHTRWNYYRSDYECRSENGQGPIVDKIHCKTPDHTKKVCRARDSHTHRPRTTRVEGPGYVDTDGDGIADTQITDLANPRSPAVTVSDPGLPMTHSSAADVGIRSNGEYTRYNEVTNSDGTTSLVVDSTPIHEYDGDSAGSGSSRTDMTADNWAGVTGD
jgi:hypothetical protein